MNDPADADLGPHALSNFPVLEAVQAGELPWIYGSYEGQPNAIVTSWISMPATIWTHRDSAKASAGSARRISPPMPRGGPRLPCNSRCPSRRASTFRHRHGA